MPVRELEVLEAARDLAQRVARDLAVLRGEVRGDLGAVLVDQVPDAEHDLGPATEEVARQAGNAASPPRPRRQPPRPMRSRPRVHSPVAGL